MMNAIFSDIILDHEACGTTIRIYMDDIGIATKRPASFQDHIAAVHDIFHVSHAHDLFYKLEKCLFHSLVMDYLGVVLEEGVTRMDPVKLDGLHNWPARPTVALYGVSWVLETFTVLLWHVLLTFVYPSTASLKKMPSSYGVTNKNTHSRRLFRAFTSAPVLVHRYSLTRLSSKLTRLDLQSARSSFSEKKIGNYTPLVTSPKPSQRPNAITTSTTSNFSPLSTQSDIGASC